MVLGSEGHPARGEREQTDARGTPKEAEDRVHTPVDAATPDRADTPVEDASHEAVAERTLSPTAVWYNEMLIQYTATRQYESSVLPGKQLGLHLAPSAVHALATTTKQIRRATRG